MMAIFSLFAGPLGYALEFICRFLPNYLLAIFVFTFFIKLLLFPVNISNQKNAAARARLAPRLERIQKKYGADRQKLMEKQQQLYEKEGVKMTAGCLPQLLQMLVLFSIIAAIYSPLTYVERMNATDIQTCITAVQEERIEDMTLALQKENLSEATFKQQLEEKTAAIQSDYVEGSYYRELHLLKYANEYHEEIETALVKAGHSPTEARDMMARMMDTEEDFSVLGVSLLGIPNENWPTPNGLWIIAILSGLSAMFTSIQSMKQQKKGMSDQQQQMGGGCTKFMMYGMPLMSLFFSFMVPAGVAVYWIFSNLLSLVQVVVLNKMYDLSKIRAQAEAEYQERRRRKAEDRARLKQARLEEQRAWQMEENEKRAQKKGKKPVKKPVATPETSDTSEDTASAEQPETTTASAEE